MAENNESRNCTYQTVSSTLESRTNCCVIKQLRHLIIVTQGRVIPHVGYPPLLLVFSVLLEKVSLALLLGLSANGTDPKCGKKALELVKSW